MIQITPEAKKYITDWLVENNAPYMYLAIQSGGCAGFEYSWEMYSAEEYDKIRMEDDEIIPLGGGYRLIVDSFSVPYLCESEIDYETSFEKKGIVVRNRFAKAACGCGKSVSF